MSSGGRKQKNIVSKSVGGSSNLFRSSTHEAYYYKLKNEKIANGKVLKEENLSNYGITNKFRNSTLVALLSLAFAYNMDFVYMFYANMEFARDLSYISSRISGRNVEITREDLEHFLGLSINGPSVYLDAHNPDFDWVGLNRRLRGMEFNQHISTINGLEVTPKVIQHVLKHTVLPKSGDQSALSPVLSVATYYVMESITFDVADLIFRHIQSVMSVRKPDARRKQNLVLGHLFAYLLHRKYDILILPREVEPEFYTDNSFYAFFAALKTRKRYKSAEEIVAAARTRRGVVESEEEGDEGDEGGGDFAEGEPAADPGEASSSRPRRSSAAMFESFGRDLKKVLSNQEVILKNQEDQGQRVSNLERDVSWIKRHFEEE